MDIFIDGRFEADYARHPLVLVDVGARGGLKRNWTAARRHLRVLGFEPDRVEYDRLVEAARRDRSGDEYFNVALHERHGVVPLYLARDRGLSSVFRPDRAFLDTFPDASRFDTEDVQQVEVDSLDDQLRARGIHDIDFVKADTQGSELFVLKGGMGALEASGLGVEVEVEFTGIYEGQPVFADVDGFMRGLGYMLFDLKPCYWKRSAGWQLGGPYGQIVWADALYFKGPAALRSLVERCGPERGRSKLLHAISIALLYGYADYALEIASRADGVLTGDERATITRRLEEQRRSSGAAPARRRAASAFLRLWKAFRVPNEGWAVSDAEIGNRD